MTEATPATGTADADEVYAERFDGVRRVYGDAGAAALRTLAVCVVGLGGVGSWSVEALARKRRHHHERRAG